MVISKFVTTQMCFHNEFCVSSHLIETSCHLTICVKFSINIAIPALRPQVCKVLQMQYPHVGLTFYFHSRCEEGVK
jgi:hypothetical protein